MLAIYDPSWLDATVSTVDLAVIGDAPYGAAQLADFPNLISAVNAAPGVSRVVHVGDIKNGSSRCDDTYFAQVAAGFSMFADPFIYTPGDNEWTDCHRANNGAYDPLERLDALRRLFYPLPGRTLGGVKKDVLTQSAIPSVGTFVENTLWAEAQVTFAAVHVVGSNNNLLPWFGDDATGTKMDDPARRIAETTAREAAGLDWLDRTFAHATRQGSKGVVLFTQADIWDPFVLTSGQYNGFTATVRRIADLTRAFGKPVLLVNGDSHVFKVDNPLAAGDVIYGVAGAVPNLTRITVQGSTTAPLTEWLRLKVEPATTAVFSWVRNPR
ncbi:MAG: metallophosphoesterase [Deltaproteobacteria bacterium]|nr:metallophosphoesterase [Deltaproteobacteria bacterium]